MSMSHINKEGRYLRRGKRESANIG